MAISAEIKGNLLQDPEQRLVQVKGGVEKLPNYVSGLMFIKKRVILLSRMKINLNQLTSRFGKSI